MSDEQFHFAINKLEITKNNKNKNKTKTRGNKKEINNNNKTQKYEQSLENSQNKL